LNDEEAARVGGRLRHDEKTYTTSGSNEHAEPMMPAGPDNTKTAEAVPVELQRVREQVAQAK